MGILVVLASGFVAPGNQNLAESPQQSVEIDLGMTSPAGPEGGKIIPASCPSYEHTPGICGPQCVSAVGAACASAPNACGQTNSGYIQCNGVCGLASPYPVSDNNTGGRNFPPGHPGSNDSYSYGGFAGWNPDTCDGDGDYRFQCPAGANASCEDRYWSAGYYYDYVTCRSGYNAVSPPPDTNCPVVSVSMSANPTTVAYGGSATISWSSTNAASCTPVSPTGWTGTSGSQSTGALTSSQTYSITCTDVAARTASASVTVNVDAPPTVDILANDSQGPITIPYGGSATLSWTSAHASSCTASGGWSGSKPLSGNESTGPLTSSKTYTITCSNGFVNATDSVTVNVNAATVSASLTPNPSAGVSPLNATLTGTITGGTAFETINYSFWWNCADTTTSVSAANTACGALPPDSGGDGVCSVNANGAKCDGETQTSITTPAHTYTAGSYTSKLIVERGPATTQAQSVIAVAAQPDLIIENLSITTGLKAGDQVTISGTVKNTGGSSAAASQTRLRIDIGNNGTFDVTPANNSTASLSINATEIETWTNVWTAVGGTHKFEICADNQATIAESNEANNCATQTFSVFDYTLSQSPKDSVTSAPDLSKEAASVGIATKTSWFTRLVELLIKGLMP